MKHLNRRIIIVLVAMALISPIGIWLPHFFNASDAWGEWSTDTVKEQLGFVPKGMEQTAENYKAPMPDYNMANSEHMPNNQFVSYVISGLVGLIIITIPTWLIYKYYQRHE